MRDGIVNYIHWFHAELEIRSYAIKKFAALFLVVSLATAGEDVVSELVTGRTSMYNEISADKLKIEISGLRRYLKAGKINLNDAKD